MIPCGLSGSGATCTQLHVQSAQTNTVRMQASLVLLLGLGGKLHDGALMCRGEEKKNEKKKKK